MEAKVAKSAKDEDKIVKNPIKCEVCEEVIAKDDCFDHFTDEAHQMAVHKDHLLKEREKTSVFVTGFPNTVPKEQLQQFFSKFGTVVHLFVSDENKYGIVQYKNAKTVEHLLNNEVKYYGRALVIKPRKLPPISLNNSKTGAHKKKNKANKSKCKDDTFAAFLPILKRINGLQNEINYILTTFQVPDRVKLPQYERLIADLRESLCTSFPNCRVYPFGSTVTGLDLTTSDVDAYVECLPVFFQNALTPAMSVNRARNVLQKNKKFGDVVSIPGAKTPIVKCVHLPTEINVDFNFKNKLGVCNTRLINYYLNLDVKLRPLMVVLKCWAKIHDVFGNGRFSSYCLTLLFIFYLQQPPYCLPPVRILQCDPAFVNMEAGWNGGFDNMFKPHFPALQCAELKDVLYGFFNLYANFEYSLYVISPFLGDKISKVDIVNPNKLPPCFEIYIRNMPTMSAMKVDYAVCLQDPFEQNHNTTRGVTARCLEEFVDLCGHAAKIFSPNSRNFSIYRLYTEESLQLNCKTQGDTCKFRLHMGGSIAYLESQIPKDSPDRHVLLQKAWFASVNEFVVSLLIRVFKFEVSTCNPDASPCPFYTPECKSACTSKSSHKSQKLEGQTDVYDKKPSVDSVKFHCISKYNVWVTRKKIMRDLVYDDTVKTSLDKQIYASDYICNVLLKDVKAVDNPMNFDIFLHAVTNPTLMEFVITKRSDKQFLFNSFITFFTTKIHAWFSAHETEKNELIKTAT